MESGHFYLESNNIKDGQINYNTEVFINDEFYEKQKDKWLHTGDMVMVQSGHVGHAAVIPEELNNSAAHALIMFRNPKEEIEPYFLNYQYQTLKSKKKIENITTGNTIKHILASEMQQFEVDMPELAEQKKIAEYFSGLDHLITLHQRKCDETKKLKKFMLQKMFPKKDAKKPEIRFAGFTDDWEQRKLDDVVEDYVERTMVENQYPVLTSSQRKGIVLQDEYFSGDKVSQSGNIGYFIIPRGYFAFRSRSDNDVFVFNRNDVVDMGIISYFYPVFKPRGVDSDFLLYRLNYGLENQIKINSEGTGQHVLSLKKFKNMIGLFPSYEEQKRIGTYFSQIDHLITLHQRKLFLNFAKRNDWEQRKLGDMGSTFTGLSGKTKEDFGHGDAQFITYMNVFSNPVANLEMTEAVEIDANQNSVKKGDVFFTTSSETPEEVGMSCVMPENKDNIYLNSFCFGYRPTEKFDLDYLAYVLRADSFRKEMTFLAQGISRYNISKNKVMEVSIPVPNLEEQTMIGRYFSTLDHLITLHRRAYYNKKGGLTNVHNDNQQHYAIL